MRLFAWSLIAIPSIATALAAGDRTSLAATDQPEYTKEGQLVLPADYRQWVFLGSGLGMTYGPAAPAPGDSPSFDNVFVTPSAFSRFKETGHWPDGTMFALEVRDSTSHGSINQGGHYQSDLAALEVHVKDSKRFAETSGSAFFAFGGGLAEPPASAAPVPVNAGCIACHTKNGAVDNTFVQFYPTALAVAEKMGTLRADYVPAPPSRSRFGRLLHEKGWAEAEKALVAARQDPYSSLAQERPLNFLGYALLREKDTANAIALFRWICQAYPKSANAHDSLADAFEAAGQPAEALAEGDKAVALLETDPSLQPERKAAVKKSVDDRKARLAKK
jgi:hypothetical protein